MTITVTLMVLRQQPARVKSTSMYLTIYMD